MRWDQSIPRGPLYRALGYAPNLPIPKFDDFQGKLYIMIGTRWEEREVRLLPGTLAGRHSSHRISVRCAHCHSWVPFGRMHQHYATATCFGLSLERADVFEEKLQ